jgi:hypothetical protein
MWTARLPHLAALLPLTLGGALARGSGRGRGESRDVPRVILIGVGTSGTAWSKLREVVGQLAEECGGSFGFVVDEGNGLWCVAAAASAGPSIADQEKAADRFYVRELAPRAQELRRGTPLTFVSLDGEERYLGVTFASIYVAVVWFERDFAPTLVRARIRKAIPEIEKLIVSLPPHGGPGRDAGAQKIRA